MSEPIAFQDQLEGNHCWGCGPLNEGGLQIKSYWSEDGTETVCHWQPAPEHTTWVTESMNGGVIATIMDCHSIWTAMAFAYREAGRAIGTQPVLMYVTGGIHVKYLRPTPIDAEITLRAHVIEATDRKSIVQCSLYAAGEECAQSELIAVKVREGWGK